MNPKMSSSAKRVRPALSVVWTCLAGVFLLLSLASFAGRWHWALDLLSHFRLHFFWSALVFCGLAAVRRHRYVMGIFAVLAAVHLWDAASLYRQAAPSSSLAGSQPVRLMSFNAWLPNSDGALLTQRVLAENPDVLFLAEMSDPLLAAMAQLKDRYPYQFPPQGQNWTSLGLFSRYPWQDAGRVVIGTAAAGKVVLKAIVATPQGPLTVVGVHTTSPMNEARWLYRNQEFTQLAHYVRSLPGPVVVMGDYNATPWSPVYRRYLKRTGFQIISPPTVPVLTWPQWIPEPLRIPIDNMTASAGVVAVRKWAAPNTGSDHMPILAEVRLVAHTVRP
jgi:endonuclease/exonuclease/phosphatase (EEP) superfamily protein YafD